MAERLRALRGATTTDADTPEAIVEATVALLGEMMSRNGISPDDLVSMILTTTPDLTSEFPALGARQAGLSDIPLLCAKEIDVPGAIGRCIRVLMHLYTDRDRSELRHVYLGDARQLRTDLPE